MKLSQIRDVVAIADHGSLRAAAQKLGLAQPALTRSVRELEHELGVDLFERHARGMTLTPLGETFIARMRVVQAEVQRSREEIDQLKGRPTGHVTVGLSMVATITLLPHVLTQFRSKFPGVRLKVIEGLFPELRQRIVDGTIDFYVGPIAEQPQPRELGVEILLHNELIVLCRKGHPLQVAQEFSALSGASWIGFSLGDAREHALNNFFQQQGLPPPHIGIEVTSALSTLVVTAHTDLLALMPQQFAKHPGAGDLLACVAIKEKLGAPRICLITRSSLGLTPAAEFLSDLFRRAAVHESKESTAAF